MHLQTEGYFPSHLKARLSLEIHKNLNYWTVMTGHTPSLNLYLCLVLVDTATAIETEHFLVLTSQERVVLNYYLTGDEKVRYPIIY